MNYIIAGHITVYFHPAGFFSDVYTVYIKPKQQVLNNCKGENKITSDRMLFHLLPVGEVIRCLWMLLEVSVLYVRGICQRKLFKQIVCINIKMCPFYKINPHFGKTHWTIISC